MAEAKVIPLREAEGGQAVDGAQSAPPVRVPDWEAKAAGALAFLRRRLTGDYDVDDYGYDPDYDDHVIHPIMKLVYDRYWRVETFGLENVPDEGAALLVSNHSGAVAIDLPMIATAVRAYHPQHRIVRSLAANFVFALPVLSVVARRMGVTVACDPDAQELLSRGELVAVFPEGVKGVGKGWQERYKLQRFGRGGFVRTAIKAGVPIIPTAVIGAEEAIPMIGRSDAIGRLVGAPYLPITPTFPLFGPVGLMPYPSKWMIHFGEPIPTDHFGPDAADDPMLLFNITDQIRENIQQQIYDLLRQRKSVFF